jgi:hypothetical protein
MVSEWDLFRGFVLEVLLENIRRTGEVGKILGLDLGFAEKVDVME